MTKNWALTYAVLKDNKALPSQVIDAFSKASLQEINILRGEVYFTNPYFYKIINAVTGIDIVPNQKEVSISADTVSKISKGLRSASLDIWEGMISPAAAASLKRFFEICKEHELGLTVCKV
jgi:hypothetical protein